MTYTNILSFLTSTGRLFHMTENFLSVTFSVPSVKLTGQADVKVLCTIESKILPSLFSFLIIYIVIDSQEIANNVERGPIYPSPNFLWCRDLSNSNTVSL